MARVTEAGGVLSVPFQEERRARVGPDPRVEERERCLLAEDQEAVVDHPVRMPVRLLSPLTIDQRLVAGTLFRLARRVMPGSEHRDDPTETTSPSRNRT